MCLCGSLRFGRELEAERARLTLDLAIVLAPEVTASTELEPTLVRALGELHLRRIDLADEVRIINPAATSGRPPREEPAVG